MARASSATTSTWAGAAASEVQKASAARERAAAALKAKQQAFGSLVQAEGARFLERLYAAISLAAAEVSTQLALPMAVGVVVRESGALTVNAHDQGFLLLVPDVGDDNQPLEARANVWLGVTLRQASRETTRHFPFRDYRGGLVLEIDGEPCGPETAAQRLCEPWFRGFTVPR